MLASLSDDTIRNSRFLLMSGKGKSMDGDYYESNTVWHSFWWYYDLLNS